MAGRHAKAFIERIKANAGYIEADFDAIHRIGYDRPFEECLVLAEMILGAAI